MLTKVQEQCPDGQLWYATYLDDCMLTQVYKSHAQFGIATDDSFVPAGRPSSLQLLNLGCAWLTVLFCSDV